MTNFKCFLGNLSFTAVSYILRFIWVKFSLQQSFFENLKKIRTPVPLPAAASSNEMKWNSHFHCLPVFRNSLINQIILFNLRNLRRFSIFYSLFNSFNKEVRKRFHSFQSASFSLIGKNTLNLFHDQLWNAFYFKLLPVIPNNIDYRSCSVPL